jgi:inorganic pyrophosphatase
MIAHPWHEVELPPESIDWFWVFVENPRGSKVKYELDKGTGLLKVDRILHSAVFYPANYGFVPRTYCEDGDPLDALVLCQEDVATAALMRARPIGVMRMRDDKGQDDKIIAVHIDDPAFADHRDIDDLPAYILRQIRQFFLDYKTLEHKEVLIESPQGAAEARRIYSEARALYDRDREHLLLQK